MKLIIFIAIFLANFVIAGFSQDSGPAEREFKADLAARKAILSEHWAQNDLSFFIYWFDSDDHTKSSDVRAWVWGQRPSDFKNRVILMMLQGSASTWGDGYDRNPHAKPDSGNERSGLMNECEEVIRPVVPDMDYSDFETPEGRSHLAAQFTAALEKQKSSPQPDAKSMPEAKAGSVPSESSSLSPSTQSEEGHPASPKAWLLIAGGVLLFAGAGMVGWKFLRGKKGV